MPKRRPSTPGAGAGGRPARQRRVKTVTDVCAWMAVPASAEEWWETRARTGMMPRFLTGAKLPPQEFPSRSGPNCSGDRSPPRSEDPVYVDIRWTRNHAGLGLVNGDTAEVASVRGCRVCFRRSDGRTLELGKNDPQMRHLDHA